MQLRRSSTTTTVPPSTRTVIVVSWFGITTANATAPSGVPPPANTHVKPPRGKRPRLNRPSGATVVVMAGFSWTVTVTVAAGDDARPADEAETVPPATAPTTVPWRTTPSSDGAEGPPQ